jgi:structural maintenance of chromosome 4
VEELNEQRGEKLNRVKIVEKEKDGLEPKKAEAMDYLTKENQLTFERSNLYQIYVHEATENVAVAEKNMVNLFFFY